jgi:tetratricopeptide (TPR) repeat protein
MVEGVTGGRALPPEVLDQVVAKTDGVPLFVEELTRMVVESGLLREESGRYVLDGPLPPLAIPATLQDSLMARLDRLAPAKEVAQAGAAIGRTFRHDLIAAVLGRPEAELGSALDRLVEAGLLFRQGVGPEAAYTFKHALVQDAAHGSLLKSQRQRLHAKIASVLETRFPDQADAAPEVVAQHYAEADLAENAIKWWLRAGKVAVARSANAEAVAVLNHALAVIDQDAVRFRDGELEYDVVAVLGPATMATTGYQSAQTAAVYNRARQLARGSRDPRRVCPILFGVWSNLWLRAQLAESRMVSDEYNDLSKSSDDVTLRSVGHSIAGQQLSAEGRFSQSLEEYTACIRLFKPDWDRTAAVRFGEQPWSACRSMGGYSLFFLGHPDQAIDWADEGLRMALAADHANTIGHALYWMAMIRQERREHDMALLSWEELRNHANAQDLATWSLTANLNIAGIQFLKTQTDENRNLYESYISSFRRAGGVVLEWSYIACMALAFQKSPEMGNALPLCNNSLEKIRRSGERWQEADMLRLRGDVLADSDRDGAQRSYARSIEVARAQCAKSYELRAATSLARLWAERGERQRAHDLLAPVYGWFTEGFGTRDLIEAKALLDALA